MSESRDGWPRRSAATVGIVTVVALGGCGASDDGASVRDIGGDGVATGPSGAATGSPAGEG